MKSHDRLRLLVLIPIVLTGCRFGDTRTEIRGNGQCGVDVKYVPNDAPPVPQSPATTQNGTSTDQARIRQQQQQIDALQSQLHEKDREIQRLKSQPATQP